MLRLKLLFLSLFLLLGCNNNTQTDTKEQNIENRESISSEKYSNIQTKLQPSDPTYIVYEDGEDGTIDKWKLYDNNPVASITNIFDENRSSRVISLNGDGTKNGYMLGDWGGSKAWNNKEDRKLLWSMNYNEKFRIYIRLDTKKGDRYIVYEDKNESIGLSETYINIGLGTNISNGKWHNLERDLEEDLKLYEPDNSIITVNAFLIRGSGLIDDVKLKYGSKEIYEDGEDNLTAGWYVDTNTPEGATITNVYDEVKNSNVIELKGDRTKNRYIFGNRTGEKAWEHSRFQVIKWDMFFNENYIIEIDTETTLGRRFLVYRPKDIDDGILNKSIRYGLGTDTKNGEWQTVIRDLNQDIQNAETNNSLIEINAFRVRGSGKIDNIEMLKRDKLVYFNGEDSSDYEWRIIDNTPTGATITQVYDNEKESIVVAFDGNGTKNRYVFGSWEGSKALYNKEYKVIKWSMKYSEKYEISIRLDTKLGERYIKYTPTKIEEGFVGTSTISYGLGTESINGKWQTFARDLEKDLKKYDPTNEIISVNGFFIKGSGKVDDLEMMYYSPLLNNTTPPTISLNGTNPTKLVIGENYIEDGAVVSDDKDSNIDVIIEGTIDTSTIGTYELIYKAVDSGGNSAIKSRIVEVVAEDKIAPTLYLLGGNPLTIKQNSIYNEEGAYAIDNIDNTPTININGVVDTSTIGTYTLTYSAIDRFGNSSSLLRKVVVEPKNDTKYSLNYRGLNYFEKPILVDNYMLEQLSNDEFNALTKEQKLIVADKLLSTLFFGYKYKELQTLVDSGNFIDEIREAIKVEKIDSVVLEETLLDKDMFDVDSSDFAMEKILSRFYAMDKLDSYFFNNWMAYSLTQTIMFSPAYELETSEKPNVLRVYNGLVRSFRDDEGIKFITYKHMMSEDNWRRFRSPEDNGREMLEIFLLDGDDTHVPLAGKALQNWRLDTESYTLVIGLNENIKPLNLFNTTIYNGDDFYRELVKSDNFIAGVTKRVVDTLFLDESSIKKAQIVDAIVNSSPKRWRDIFEQIIFSKAYLLENSRAKKAEETFFSLAKKMQYNHYISSFSNFKNALIDMHQASMKYKLGKLDPVPLDTLSFAYYYQFIRERLFQRKSNDDYLGDYSSSRRQGWSEDFIGTNQFNFDINNKKESFNDFINLIFKTTISREANSDELALFNDFFYLEDEEDLKSQFNIFMLNDDLEYEKEKRAEYRANVAKVILEYISRLDAVYKFLKVEQ